ncbi:MAG TPA: hypothetical protein VGG71_08460 [Chitinophagaceae bacterium]|jgi:hypothetical protein
MSGAKDKFQYIVLEFVDKNDIQKAGLENIRNMERLGGLKDVRKINVLDAVEVHYRAAPQCVGDAEIEE